MKKFLVVKEGEILLNTNDYLKAKRKAHNRKAQLYEEM